MAKLRQAWEEVVIYQVVGVFHHEAHPDHWGDTDGPVHGGVGLFWSERSAQAAMKKARQGQMEKLRCLTNDGGRTLLLIEHAPDGEPFKLLEQKWNEKKPKLRKGSTMFKTSNGWRGPEFGYGAAWSREEPVLGRKPKL